MSWADRVWSQAHELAVSHGLRGESLPGVPPQSDRRGKGSDILDAPHGLVPHTGGTTRPPGARGHGNGHFCTGSPYQGAAYSEGVAATSVVGAGGTYS